MSGVHVAGVQELQEALSLPQFPSHPVWRGGHLQTVVGYVVRQTPAAALAGVPHEVLLPDGDRVVLHDDRPEGWRDGDPAALMIHGLAGNHASPYMQRIAVRFHARGVRTFRMDLRGCGAGLALARFPYHSGRSGDAAAALQAIGRICPDSPLTLVGFSLGGNMTLKLLGENPAALPANLVQAVAVCPPVDLLHCVGALTRGMNRLYDRYFARLLVQQIAARQEVFPEAVVPAGWPHIVPDGSRRSGGGRIPRGVREFDEWFTAPVSGFGTAENYYRLCGSAQFLPAIRTRTLILAAADDPLVPSAPLEEARLPAAVTLHLTGSGGHLGYVGRAKSAVGRWMDWRVVDWCCAGTEL